MGNIIGAHNGTVIDWSINEFAGFNQYDVDSKIIFNELNNSKDLQYIWSTADGAMTLTWWDETDQSFNIATNGKRPLHYTLAANGSKILYASEDWMLYGALSRNKINTPDIIPFKHDVHYKFTTTEEGVVSIKETPLEPFKEWVNPKANNNKSNGYKTELVSFYIEEYVAPKPKEDGNFTPEYFYGSTDTGKRIKIWGVNTTLDKSAHEVMCELNTYSCDTVYEGTAHLIEPLDKTESWYLISWKNVYEDTDFTWEEMVDPPEKVDDKSDFVIGWKQIILNKDNFLTKANLHGCVNCCQPIRWEQRNSVRWVGPEDVACPICRNLEVVLNLAA
jgi:hypothetical protein